MHRFLAVPILICFTAVGAFAAADTGLLALIPGEARVVSSIDVQQARSSPFGQFLLANMNSDPNNCFDKMAQETGFDPRRDLQTFVFASPGPGASRTQSSFVILARGNFDSQWIRKQVLANNGTIQNIDGVDVYIGNSHHQQQQAFALPDVGIAVFGDLASVQEVIANRANTSQLDPALQALISKVSANSDAWFASVLPGSYLTQHLNDATNQQAKSQAQALQSVRQAAGGVVFGDPVQLTFDAVTRSPQDAVSLEDVVRFMASILQMQRQQNPQSQVLASSLDNMTLTASGDQFH
ncbi:MAG: hypothetical protein JO051_03100, partial [Acidobacteriaceae bacterium]|nr:hypothetical protein [Acidobacteriaceae bacterium]